MTDDEEDFPPIHYPHPIEGYEWELERWRYPEQTRGDAAAELLLEVAKGAYKIKEIRENLLAEREYWEKYGKRDENGFPINSPMGVFYMIQRFYASYVVKNNLIDQYYSYSTADLVKLLIKWVTGEAPIGDDENSIKILRETRDWGKSDA